MIVFRPLFVIFLVMMALSITGQGIVLQSDYWQDHQVNRHLIKTASHVHPTLRYYPEEVLGNTGALNTNKGNEEGVNTNGEKVYTDSSETFYILAKKEKTTVPRSGFFRHFFTNPDYLYSKYGEDYFIRINPILSFKGGSSSVKDGALFQNTRGLELSGGIGKRFFFFTNIVETQSRFPSYVDDYIEQREAIPGNGFYKRYKSTVVDLEDAYDYLNSTGYLSVKVSEQVGFTLGHGRHFIGSGMRSMLLSDFSNNYFYLQADWKFWKIHYRNIWSEVKPRSARGGLQDEEVRRKYLATHHLSLALLPNLHFGLFESVVFDRSDQFELSYLNPVILFRTVEQSLSSPDNVLLGIDLRWDAWKTVSFYGQMNFDEFVFSELIVDNRGWWGNKYAWQLGFQYVDVLGVDNLDIRMEYNGARPYTYTHRDSSASYSHSNLALAHPVGANFEEVLVDLRYSINNRWFFSYTFAGIGQGRDIAGENYGGNILLPHDTRIRDYDNDILQGDEHQISIHRLRCSYQIFRKCWVDFEVSDREVVRDVSSENEFIISGGIRWNFNTNNFLF